MHRQPLVLFLLPLILFLATGCEVKSAPALKPRLVVHSLLHAGTHYLRAKVNRSYPIEERIDTLFSDAAIAIWSDTDIWHLQYLAGDSYTTRTPVPIQEGKTYFIRVSKTGFDTVWGKTVVPGGFEILFPRPGDTVAASDSMVWTRSQDARGYFISIPTTADQDTFYWDIFIPNDSFGPNYHPLLVRIPNMFFLFPLIPPPDSPPRPCTLRVWALDTSYFLWGARNGLVAGGETVPDSNRLLGGLGVFGAATARLVPVFLTGDTTR